MIDAPLPDAGPWNGQPPGLHAFLALVRTVGGPGPGPQLVAAGLFAGATALVIFALARTLTTRPGAVLAALAYLLWLPLLDPHGPNSAIFANLFIALAALASFRLSQRADSATLVRDGAAVMLLAALAVEIKLAVVVEAAGIGLLVLWRAYADAWDGPRLGWFAVWLAAVALLPLSLTLAYYSGHGLAAPFVQATLHHVLPRPAAPRGDGMDLLLTLALLLPFVAAILAGFRADRREGAEPAARTLITFWVLLALIGYLAFGRWSGPYAGALLAPLAVLAAPALGRTGQAMGWTLLLFGFGAAALAWLVPGVLPPA